VATYIVKMNPPSHEGFKTWVMMGYTGSYEHYEAAARENQPATMFIKGDLGPHCTECSAPGDNLCDYPVGDEKTCDRPMCDDHGRSVAADTHYCRDHFIMWREYLASQRGYDVLDNVTPLGVVRSVTQGMSAGTVETGTGSGRSPPARSRSGAPTLLAPPTKITPYPQRER
jgi:hypothetical protein